LARRKAEGDWWGSRAEAREMMRTGWSGVGRQGVVERVEVERVGEGGLVEEEGVWEGRKGEDEVMLTSRLSDDERGGGRGRRREASGCEGARQANK